MHAERIITNARVFAPGRAPAPSAVAVGDGRIVAVGSGREVLGLAGADTETIDAGGRTLLPGFNDAHVHLFSAGLNLLADDYRDAADEAEFARRAAAAAAGLPEGAWLTRGRWDHEAWPGGRRPTRDLLDAAVPGRPVLLRRLDGHIAVANSLALRIAGVTAATADPPGGHIERDAAGEPTGILVDAAQDLVEAHVPLPAEAELLQAARAALAHAGRLGLTSLHVICSAEQFELLGRLARGGELTARVHALLPPADLDAAVAAVADQDDDDLLRAGTIKLFADGSFGARSALLSRPYDDDPSTRGLAMHSGEELRELIGRADAAGLQAAVHAIGDEAVHRVLDAIEAVLRAGGRRGARHRIEHAQMVRPADRPRFAQLGVVASIQPTHCTDDMRWIARRLGDRCELAYPYASLRRAGARIALGTDWDVEPLEPLAGVYAAVTRQRSGGGPAGGWFPDEKVCLSEAVFDYTAGPAWAEFQDGRKGEIVPGQWADLALLDRDILAADPAEILAARVEATFLAGRTVWSRTADVG